MVRMGTLALTSLPIIILMTSHLALSVPCSSECVDDETRVFCNRRRLTKLPRVWPVDHVTWLDLSTNFLTSFREFENARFLSLRHLEVRDNQLNEVNWEDLSHMPNLTHLDLSGNPLEVLPEGALERVPRLTFLGLSKTKLKVVHDRAFIGLSQLVTLDLSHNQLGVIPVLALKPLRALHSLDLSWNGIQNIEGDSFRSLANLVSLKLSDNGLSQLPPLAFSGLGNLKGLDFSHNNIPLTNGSYAPGVFIPLSALESLYINSNDKNRMGTYPLNVFNPLISLKLLSIDGLIDGHFEAFSSLKNLTHLIMEDNCHLGEVTNTTFAVFKNSSLQYLSLSCSIGHIEPCAFCDLPNLKILRLHSNSHLKIEVAFQAMYGLQNQSLSLIDLSHNVYRIEAANINSENTKYFANVCVEELNLHSCLIGSISTSSFNSFKGPFSTCLKRLDISNNVLNSWMIFRLYIRVMTRLRNLEEFRMQDQQSRSITDDICFLQTERCQVGPLRTSRADMTCYLPVSKKLRVLNVSGFISNVHSMCQVLDVHRAADLQTVDLSYLGLARCDFQIVGLASLQTLNLRGNFCRLMINTFFDDMGALRHLTMASLNLDPEFLLAEGKRLFSNLSRLEDLDLSFNTLSILQTNMLTNQPHLQRLNLAHNRFQHVPLDVTHLTSLADLDLSFNIMMSLSPSERLDFDSLAHARRPATFTLRLRGNPLSCACSELGFVQWLASTSVWLDGDNHDQGFDEDYDGNGRVYPCVTEDGQRSNTMQVMAEWGWHWRHCYGQQMLWMALTLLSLQQLGLMITFILSRNWSHVLYAFYALRNYRLPRREDFRKDAYLGYADADVELAVEMQQCLRQRRSVNLLLRYEEELPGSVRAENVVENIDDSWKVLVMVTRAMTGDEWSIFTVQLAQRSISDTMPNRVIIVFRDDKTSLPHMASLERLLRMVPERNVLYIPRDSSPRLPVWDRLTDLILANPPRT